MNEAPTATAPIVQNSAVKTSPMLRRLLAHGNACRSASTPDAKPTVERAVRAMIEAREG